MNRNRILKTLLTVSALLAMILDAKTAFRGASEGLELCLKVVIPSLFPYLFLCALLTEQMKASPTIRFPLEKPLGMPRGTGMLWVLGFLGGYPSGAQNLNQWYCGGKLQKTDAQRMLGFCSNAGPAFLFGMGAKLFENPIAPWMLFGIHILSSFLTGLILPGKSSDHWKDQDYKPETAGTLFRRSLAAMAGICGWVILFRILYTFLLRWFGWLFPDSLRCLLAFLLELSNGVKELGNLPLPGLRFLIFAPMLSFGGLCVYMQTLSVTQELGCGFYLRGKLLQSLFSLILAVFLEPFLFLPEEQFHHPALWFAAIPIFYFALKKCKFTVAFPRKMQYNSFKNLQ